MRVRIECRHRQSFPTTCLRRRVKREGSDTRREGIIANTTLLGIGTSLLLNELVENLKDIINFTKFSCSSTVVCMEITLQCEVYHFPIVLNTRKATSDAETVLVKFKNFSERHMLGTRNKQKSMTILIPTKWKVSIDTFHYEKLELDYSE